jgi:cytochrome P450
MLSQKLTFKSVIAGFDTTATAMTGLLWYLHVNPKVSSKLTTEIRNEFHSLDDITLQRCMKLSYLQACIEEGLRMHSPIKMGLPRVTPPEGMAIAGKFVPGHVRCLHYRQIASFVIAYVP